MAGRERYEGSIKMQGELMRQGTMRAKTRFFTLNADGDLNEYLEEQHAQWPPKQSNHAWLPTRVEAFKRQGLGRLRVVCCERQLSQQETVIELFSKSKSSLTLLRWQQSIQLSIEMQKHKASAPAKQVSRSLQNRQSRTQSLQNRSMSSSVGSSSSVERAEEDGCSLNISAFDLVRVLGRGSYGKVMLVRRKSNPNCLASNIGEDENSSLSNLYAVKVLHKHELRKRNVIRQTILERAILHRYQHPFIARLAGAFQTERKLYLVMPFLSGGELLYWLQRAPGGVFAESRCRLYAAEISLALRFLHSRGLIYRDLKVQCRIECSAVQSM
jgi:hypothetical protein